MNLSKIATLVIMVLIFISPSLGEYDNTRLTTLTFTNLGIAKEFTSSNGGDTPIGYFNRSSNEFPLNLSINSKYSCPIGLGGGCRYGLTVYINDVPVTSTSYVGSGKLDYTLEPENLHVGKNSIFIRVRNECYARDFVPSEPLSIYGTSKISYLDISSVESLNVVPVLTPITVHEVIIWNPPVLITVPSPIRTPGSDPTPKVFLQKVMK